MPHGNLKNQNGLKIFWISGFITWIFAAITLLLNGNHSIFKQVHLNHSPLADILFRNITHWGEFSIIAIAIVLVIIKFRSLRFTFLAILSQLIPFLITQGLKLWFAAPRPFAVFGNEKWFHQIDGVNLNTALSFPSGHTSGAFALFTFLSFCLSYKYRYIAFLYFGFACLVAYSRMYLGQHFFTDVYAGSIIGTFFCTLIIYIFQKTKKDKS